jgi:hypothetical protein
MRIYLYVFILLAAGLSSNGLSAGEIIEKKFSVFGLKRSLGEVSFLNDGAVETLQVSSRRRSEVQLYRGPQELMFFRGGLDAQGNPVEILARTSLRPDLKQPLLLFASVGDGLVILQIEDDALEAPAGSVRFMNLTQAKQKLYIALGENGEFNDELEPGGLTTYNLDPRYGGRLPIRLAGMVDGKIRMLEDTVIFPTVRNRYIYFFYQPDEARPRIQTRLLRQNMQGAGSGK